MTSKYIEPSYDGDIEYLFNANEINKDPVPF